MNDLTFVELFAGAGGLSMGLELAGWSCIGHAEIEPHARAVLRRQWPDVPLSGDVTQLDGSIFTGVTLLSGGSPCQDISVAGKRSGMTEGSETRSSLFFEQVRIWRESDAPYFLSENVLGAFSSNAGRDFAAVLSALVGAAIPVPADGWRSGGVAAGRTGVAAWRVCDAQFFGVPQRRRRVFVLCARAGGVDPAEVLSLSESLCRDFAPRAEAGEGVADDAADGAGTSDFNARVAGTLKARGGNHAGQGAEEADRLVVDAVYLDGMNQDAGSVAATVRSNNHDGHCVVAPTLAAGAHPGGANGMDAAQIAHAIIAASGQANAEIGRDVAPALTGLHEAPIVFGRERSDSFREVDVGLTLTRRDVKDSSALVVQRLLVFETKATEVTVAEDVSPTLRAMQHDKSHANGGSHLGVVTYDARGNGDGETVAPLTGDHANRVSDYTPLVLAESFKPSHFTRGKDRAPSEIAAPLSAEADRGDQEQVVYAINNDSRGASTSDTSPALRSGKRSAPSALDGVPRRLLPIECERLMGWPDEHTARGVNEQGKSYALSDSARYKLTGNGVARYVSAWVGWRLRALLEGNAR